VGTTGIVIAVYISENHDRCRGREEDQHVINCGSLGLRGVYEDKLKFIHVIRLFESLHTNIEQTILQKDGQE